MLKKINSRIITKTYLDFNKDNEIFGIVEHQGTLGGLLGENEAEIETGLSVCVTERGNYIVTEFSDLYRGKSENLATGISIEAGGEIVYNGEILTESFRKKIDSDSYAVIKTKEGDAVFYPVSFENELYVQYDKDKNAIEFISVSLGLCEADFRNSIKTGVFFGEEKYFIREDATPYLFNACSIKTAGY